MSGLRPGIRGHAEAEVNETNIASALGSGALPVFATPSMIALMEAASQLAVQPYLEEGQGTVGVHLDVSHLAATPMGLRVRAESELIEIDRRMLRFKVEAWAGEEKIGEGTHTRCIIYNDRFLEKALAKKDK